MKKSIFTLIIVLTIYMRAHAYDQYIVHPLIKEKAALQSQNFISVLVALGYKEQPPYDILTASYVKDHSIKEWLRLGATQEDVPDCRSKYHFHDPTKTFDEAGLSSLAINTVCANWSNYSSVKWAQHQPNMWSWQKARDYYHQALTAFDKTAREQNLADTFRAVGQVMHLLADASVPEHTRNDIHIFPWLDNATQSFPQIGSWTYETWCKWHVLNLNTNATARDYGITNTSVVPGIIPIFNFWDTTPLPITGSFIPVGLAEYTNYNFLSRDTIFKDFVYPEQPNHYVGVAVAEDGVTDNRIYFRGTTSDNKVINHLASTGYLWSELSQISAYTMDDSRFNLDDNCFKDYADILVPKAVSYTAGLLNYFFRGSIEIGLPDDGVYAITGPDGTFTKIKLKARNSTAAGEEMTNGTIQLVVKYKTALTDPFQMHNDCTDKTDSFSHIVVPEASNLTSLPTTSTTLTFDLTGNAIPLWATDVYLQIVYKGQLGNETNSVAVGFKDISEPTPLDLRNDMDWVCINGTNYPTGSAEANAAFIAALGYVPALPSQTVLNDYLAFTQIDAPKVVTPTYYHAYFASIDPGYYGRIYVLGDNDAFWFSNQRNSLPATGYYGTYSLINQDETIDGIEYCNYSPFSTQRGLTVWDWHYIALPAYPPSSVCPPINGPLKEQVPVPVTIRQLQ